MIHLSFSANPVNKCASQVFADIRQFDKDKHFPGAKVEIWYRGQNLGQAEIKSIVHFHYENINDSISFMAFGKESLSVKAMLSRFYSPVQPKTIFTFIVMEWAARNIPAQEALMADWWSGLAENYKNPAQTELFHQ
jgi:hypothetical protein